MQGGRVKSLINGKLLYFAISQAFLFLIKNPAGKFEYPLLYMRFHKKN